MAVVVGSIVLALGGVILIGVGFAGLLGRLPRNRWAGVRTPSSLASDHAFTLANRVAGPAVLAGGTLLLLASGSVVGFDGPLRPVAVTLNVLGALALVVAGGALGTAAARATTAAGTTACTASTSTASTSRCATCPGCTALGVSGA